MSAGWGVVAVCHPVPSANSLPLTPYVETCPHDQREEGAGTYYTPCPFEVQLCCPLQPKPLCCYSAVLETEHGALLPLGKCLSYVPSPLDSLF